MAKIVFEDWGLIEYSKAWEQQQKLFSDALLTKQSGEEVCNYIILCEHSPVITLGKNANRQNILFSAEVLQQHNVSLFQTDRGGDVTFHGPGQLVVYPILDLEVFQWGLKKYISTIEDIIIRLLKKKYNIQSGRLDGAPGIWIEENNPLLARKICAVGVKSSRYITMHGLALNVNTDLSPFSFINPCGFTNNGVTSISQELDSTQDFEQCKMYFKEIAQEFFCCN